jgi:hypothetical protein
MGHIEVADVKEGVETDHVHGHGIGPFEDLGVDINKEGIRGPASEDHNISRAVDHQEERHGGAGVNRVVPDLVRMKSEGCLAAIE